MIGHTWVMQLYPCKGSCLLLQNTHKKPHTHKKKQRRFIGDCRKQKINKRGGGDFFSSNGVFIKSLL